MGADEWGSWLERAHEAAVAGRKELVRLDRMGFFKPRHLENAAMVMGFSVFPVIEASLRQGDGSDVPVITDDAPDGTAIPDRCWMVSLVDGWANVDDGERLFAMSLALVDHGRPVVGVVDLPFRGVRGVRFWATAGSGAFRDGEQLKIRTVDRLADNLVALDEGTTAGRALTARPEQDRVQLRARRAPALDLAWLADGRLDGVVVPSARPCQMAAGVVIAREAEADVVFTDASRWTVSSKLSASDSATVAAGVLLCDELLAANADDVAGTSGHDGDLGDAGDADEVVGADTADEAHTDTSPDAGHAADADADGDLGDAGDADEVVGADIADDVHNATGPDDVGIDAGRGAGAAGDHDIDVDAGRGGGDDGGGGGDGSADDAGGGDGAGDPELVDIVIAKLPISEAADLLTDDLPGALRKISVRGINAAAVRISEWAPSEGVPGLFVRLADAVLVAEDLVLDAIEDGVTRIAAKLGAGPRLARLAGRVAAEIVAQPFDEAVQAVALGLRLIGWALEIEIARQRVLGERAEALEEPLTAEIPVVRDMLLKRDPVDWPLVRDLAMELEPEAWSAVRDLAVALDRREWRVVRDLAFNIDAVDWVAVHDLLFAWKRRDWRDPTAAPGGEHGDRPVWLDRPADQSPLVETIEELVEAIRRHLVADEPATDPAPDRDARQAWLERLLGFAKEVATAERDRKVEVGHVTRSRGLTGVGAGREVQLPPVQSWASVVTGGSGPDAAPGFEWYGEDPEFRATVERDAGAITGFDAPASVELYADRLVYLFPGLVVPGDRVRHDVRIEFRRPERQPWWSYGIDACDQPAVFTSSNRERYHDNGKNGLCLWTPFDPPERRWQHGDGLRTLVELTRRHLFLCLHWWRTGGRDGGEWLGEEFPHGVPREWVARTDFSGADFSGRDMGGAELSGAHLVRARLSRAILLGADLSRADLAGADLTGANLAGADLSGANLAGADLTGAILLGANLTGANLVGADLSRAVFLNADLRGANLSGADLRGAILVVADLPADRRERAVGAGLTGVVFDDTTTWPDGFTPPPHGVTP